MSVHAVYKVQVASQCSGAASSPRPRQVGGPLHGCNGLQVGQAGQRTKGVVHVVLLHALPAVRTESQ